MLYRDARCQCAPTYCTTMIPWLLVGALLTHAVLPHCAATLDERAFPPLSSPALADLANMRDPLRNLDPSDPYSHLQKILIPRPGMHITSSWSPSLFAGLLIVVQPTPKTTPSSEITSSRRSASSTGT